MFLTPSRLSTEARHSEDPARGIATADGEPASVAGEEPARGSAGLPDPVD